MEGQTLTPMQALEHTLLNDENVWHRRTLSQDVYNANLPAGITIEQAAELGKYNAHFQQVFAKAVTKRFAAEVAALPEGNGRIVTYSAPVPGGVFSVLLESHNDGETKRVSGNVAFNASEPVIKNMLDVIYDTYEEEMLRLAKA